jgi:hypothetical protein
MVAIDNMPEEIVGWRWYKSDRRRRRRRRRRRYNKVEANIYSITPKRSSSP